MKKHILLLCICISFAMQAYSQSNFKQGYIISSENDTTHGWIDYRTDKINSQTCTFRESEHSESKMFHPGNIAGYRFSEEGKYYVSHRIEIDYISQNVFLEFLIQGEMNLYTYTNDEELKYYFFEDSEGKMISIRQRPDERTFNEERKIYYMRKDMAYKGVLRYIFKDHVPILSNVNKIDFDDDSMMKLTKDYHDRVCTTGEECIVFEGKPDKNYTRIKFSVYAGMQWQKHKFEQNSYSVRAISPYHASPVIGAQFDFSVPRWMKSISLLLDISVSNVKMDITAKESTLAIPIDQTFKGINGSGKLGVKYTYPKGNWRPTIEIGHKFTHFFNSSYKHSEGSNQSFVLYPELNYNSYSVGLGLNYHVGNDRFVFCRMLYDQSFSIWPKKFVDGKDKLRTYQIVLGYTL